MAQSSSLSSNNPFRRNAPGAPAPALAAPDQGPAHSPVDDPPPLLSSDQFRSQLEDLGQPAHPPPATTFQKPKVVKKVRVQSPPPSSPESAGVPDPYSRADEESDEGSLSGDDDDGLNPFGSSRPAVSHHSEGVPDGGVGLPQPALHGPPPNPFQRTLQDLELGKSEGEQGPSTPQNARGALDVDAFKRLLLTGQAGGLGATPMPSAPAPQAGHPGTQTDGASLTDASSVSRHSLFDATHAVVQETPRTSHEISEPDRDDDQHVLISNSRAKAQPPTTLRKKPPPPSSRHGKLIKVELKDKNKAEGGSSPLGTPSTPLEINKPLPPSPERHLREVESESVFDREAAGKVPEPAEETVAEPLAIPRPPTPPNASHSTRQSVTPVSPTPKKPPPPPARRHPHGRSDSKASIIITAPAPVGAPPSLSEEADTSVRRSSQDSTRSRSSSLRVSVHAPAPPPPRRPNHVSRASNSFTSPSAISSSSILSSGSERSPSETAELSPLAPAGQIRPSSSHDENVPPAEGAAPSPSHPSNAQPKLFPPPPPPARNASTRSKRPPSVSSMDATSKRLSAQMPPPPPPRLRGSSKGSVDGSAMGTPGGSRILGGALAEEPAVDVTVATGDSSAANDILADLTALQREVDLLRGRVEKGA